LREQAGATPANHFFIRIEAECLVASILAYRTYLRTFSCLRNVGIKDRRGTWPRSCNMPQPCFSAKLLYAECSIRGRPHTY